MRKRLSAVLTTAAIFTNCLTLCPTSHANAASTNYVFNQAPLQNTPYAALPLGSVTAKGWLQSQLEYQRDGLTGNAETLYSELSSESGWLGNVTESRDMNWERAPYYVKGLVPLAYTLQDENLKQKAKKWIDWSINSQVTNSMSPDFGYFGPKNDNDWWPRMVMLYAIRDYYEATNDARVISFMKNYFQYQLKTLPTRPLNEWGKSRACDNIDSVIWLYNRIEATSQNQQTRDDLLVLIDLLKSQGINWTETYTNGVYNQYETQHSVNLNQCLKAPAIIYQRTKDNQDKNAFQCGITSLMRDYGLIMDMPSGTESLRGKSTTDGVETCAVVERMLSNETALKILGQPWLGDQLEKIAYNALPACLSKDFKQLQYFILPNQVASKWMEFPPYPEGGKDALMLGPHSGWHCCCFDVHMGWPKLVQNMWMASNDNGIAVAAYGPSEVNAKVGTSGVDVKFTETTNYPFDEQIKLAFSSSQSVEFPLHLRIPEWCRNASIKVNGSLITDVSSGTYKVINRVWSPGDIVEIVFPMKVKASTWANNSVGIERGPLIYSLKIGETWKKFSEDNTNDSFPDYTVTPNTPWNYGLMIDPNEADLDKYFTVEKKSMPFQPFKQSDTPVTLKVNAKQIPSWVMAANGYIANEPPVSPVESTQSTEQITLVPFGAENLRVSNFPVIKGASQPVTAKNLALNTSGYGYPKVSASYTFMYDSVWQAVDGIINYQAEPRNRWTSYESQNRDEYFEVDFGSPKDVSNINLYFYDDNGGVQKPLRYAVQYWNGVEWKVVSNALKNPARTTGNTKNTITFDKIMTQKIRVVMLNGYDSKVGLTEIEVFE